MRSRMHSERRLDLVSVRERLSENAFLFEHPEDYAAGVADALEVVREELAWSDAEDERVSVEG